MTCVAEASCSPTTRPAGRPDGGAPAAFRWREPAGGNLVGNADDYRLEWLEDGFPGRRRDGVLEAHPIYGAYVLKDYLAQHQRSPSQELRDAIADVARVSLRRMGDFEGALVFWYEADEQSALASAARFAELTGSRAANCLVTSSLREMARVVPLYDVPEVYNSRYGLTGFVYVRLVLRGRGAAHRWAP